MSVLILTHPSSHQHVTPPGHPERIDRIRTVDSVLARAEFDSLPRAEASAASDAALARAHSPAYVEAIKRVAPGPGRTVSLDPDTHMSEHSLTAARHAAGSNIDAVEAVVKGDVSTAFCAVRPCGHHAERERAMGFCLFGNVAVGALHALDVLGLERVAVVDFDVHHGNGTQDILWDEKRAFFASSHQYPLYPGTGAAHETGAHGNVLNVPLAPMTGGGDMRLAYERKILPALSDFDPELVIISAGFDAHASDPLANLNWLDRDFAWVTAAICKVARETAAKGRVVSSLEGGYDLDGLAESVIAHLHELIAHAEAVREGRDT